MIKEIEERDAYIRTLESEFRTEKSEANVKKNRNSVKSPLVPETAEPELSKEVVETENHPEMNVEVLLDSDKPSSRDQEIMKLRKIIDENQKQISKITLENKEISGSDKNFQTNDDQEV